MVIHLKLKNIKERFRVPKFDRLVANVEKKNGHLIALFGETIRESLKLFAKTMHVRLETIKKITGIKQGNSTLIRSNSNSTYVPLKTSLYLNQLKYYSRRFIGGASNFCFCFTHLCLRYIYFYTFRDVIKAYFNNVI